MPVFVKPNSQIATGTTEGERGDDVLGKEALECDFLGRIRLRVFLHQLLCERLEKRQLLLCAEPASVQTTRTKQNKDKNQKANGTNTSTN